MPVHAYIHVTNLSVLRVYHGTYRASNAGGGCAAGGNDQPCWLLEKSPTHALASRYLQGLLDLPSGAPTACVPTDQSVPASAAPAAGSRARFLFMTRHPIANALAHRHFLADASRVTFETLLAHWVAVQRCDDAIDPRTFFHTQSRACMCLYIHLRE